MVTPFYNTIHRLIWYMMSWPEWWIHFLFSNLISGENCSWSPSFLFNTTRFSLDTYGETTYWITLVWSMVCWDQLVCWWYILSFTLSSTSRMYLGVHFLMTYVLQQQFLYCFIWSPNQFLLLNIFSFLLSSDFFTYQLDSSDPWILCHLLVS